MTNQHDIDIAEECEHRMDEHYSVHSSINCKSVNVAELHADLARYAAHMRRQAERIAELEQQAKQWECDWDKHGEFDLIRSIVVGEQVSPRPGSVTEIVQKAFARIATLEKLVREAMPVMQAAKSDIEAYTADFKGFEPERDFVTRWLYAAREAAGEGD